MRTPVIPLRYIFVVVCLLIVISYITPFSQRKSISYLDIVNGRRMTVEKTLGFVMSSQVVDTQFSKLVSSAGLTGKPQWIVVADAGSDIFGNGTFSSIHFGSMFAKQYEDFARTPFPMIGMSDPTTAVLELRQLAKRGDHNGARVLVAQLHEAASSTTSSTSESPKQKPRF